MQSKGREGNGLRPEVRRRNGKREERKEVVEQEWQDGREGKKKLEGRVDREE